MNFKLDSSFSISFYHNTVYTRSSNWTTLLNKLHTDGTYFMRFYLGIDSSRNILQFRVGNYYADTFSALD